MIKRTSTIIALVAVAALCAPDFARAESADDTGSSGLSAAVDLDFRVIIPGFLTFQVGTSGATVDLIDFDLSAVSPSTFGDSSAQSGTGGDVGGGVVSAAVTSNVGQVTITESNALGSGMLTGVGGSELSYSEILTATNDSDLPAPTLSDAGGNTSQPTLNSGTITNRSAQWTYTYANTTIPDEGTYGGAGGGVNNGRVTYTAATP